MFKTKEASTLLHAINMFSFENMPVTLKGAINCVDFLEGSTRFGMCLKDEKEAEKLIDAVNTFIACRKGDDLRTVNVKDVIKSGCI